MLFGQLRSVAGKILVSFIAVILKSNQYWSNIIGTDCILANVGYSGLKYTNEKIGKN